MSGRRIDLRRRGRRPRRDRLIGADRAGSLGDGADIDRCAFQELSTHVPAASEEASTNLQSIATATDDPRLGDRDQPPGARFGADGQARRSCRPARPTIASASCRRPRFASATCRADQRHRRSDQSAGLEGHHGGRRQGRSSPRFRGGRRRKVKARTVQSAKVDRPDRDLQDTTSAAFKTRHRSTRSMISARRSGSRSEDQLHGQRQRSRSRGRDAGNFAATSRQASVAPPTSVDIARRAGMGATETGSWSTGGTFAWRVRWPKRQGT